MNRAKTLRKRMKNNVGRFSCSRFFKFIEECRPGSLWVVEPTGETYVSHLYKEGSVYIEWNKITPTVR